MKYIVTIVTVIIVTLYLVSSNAGGGVVLVDNSIAPVVTDDNKLQVTLQNGEQDILPIYGTDNDDETDKDECNADVYRDIGSLTYVDKKLATETFRTSAERAARREELTAEILGIRDDLKSAFLADFRSGNVSDIAHKHITCDLSLQPDDIIFMRLKFAGPASSNVTVDCLTGDGDTRAEIRNPATTAMHLDKDAEPAMVFFKPTNCGVDMGGDDDFIDELGGVRSRCNPVKNVTIRNCRIRGRITASSLPGNLHSLSMVRADHVARLRQSAAQHVNFTNVRIKGRYKGAVHFLPGVHHFTIEDSEVLGGFHSMTIHLPADGGWNIIKNNKITGQRKTNAWPWEYSGKKREVISIDSSEHNRIVNNHIMDMTYGGIHLYRNCGERGDIRHRIPQYNQIINNVFDYSEGSKGEPTIFLGARDDKSIKWSFGFGVKKYCHEDEGSNGQRFTGNDAPEEWDTETVRNSSESNSDWAQNNVIADNQIIGTSQPLNWIITLSSKAKKLNNYLIGNEVAKRRSPTDALRKQRRNGAGCAVLAGITHDMQSPFVAGVKNGHLPYIRNNWNIKYFWDIRPEVLLGCGTPLVCRNNRLVENATETCNEPVIRDFGSQSQACGADDVVCVEGNNSGDEHTLGCPGGKLIGIQAVCNLEHGKATDAQRQKVLLNHVKIVRKSDHKGDGLCMADETRIREGQSLIVPWFMDRYEATGSTSQIRYKCKEHDENGGDCHVNVRHYCIPFGPLI